MDIFLEFVLKVCIGIAALALVVIPVVALRSVFGPTGQFDAMLATMFAAAWFGVVFLLGLSSAVLRIANAVEAQLDLSRQIADDARSAMRRQAAAEPEIRLSKV